MIPHLQPHVHTCTTLTHALLSHVHYSHTCTACTTFTRALLSPVHFFHTSTTFTHTCTSFTCACATFHRCTTFPHALHLHVHLIHSCTSVIRAMPLNWTPAPEPLAHNGPFVSRGTIPGSFVGRPDVGGTFTSLPVVHSAAAGVHWLLVNAPLVPAPVRPRWGGGFSADPDVVLLHVRGPNSDGEEVLCR